MSEYNKYTNKYRISTILFDMNNPRLVPVRDFVTYFSNTLVIRIGSIFVQISTILTMALL